MGDLNTSGIASVVEPDIPPLLGTGIGQEVNALAVPHRVRVHPGPIRYRPRFAISQIEQPDVERKATAVMFSILRETFRIRSVGYPFAVATDCAVGPETKRKLPRQ